MSAWKKLSERIVYENPWTRLREDQVLRPDGQPGIYGVVERKNQVGVVAVNQQGQVYVQHDYKYPIGKALLNIMAGGNDEGDALEAAKRELKEEAGLVAGRWTKLGMFYNSPGVSNEQATMYLAQDILEQGPTAHEGTEIITDSRWEDAARLYDMLDRGELEDAYIIIGLALARQYLQPKV